MEFINVGLKKYDLLIDTFMRRKLSSSVKE